MSNDRMKCKRCGSASFRYKTSTKKSYCLACGLEVTEADWNDFKNKMKPVYDKAVV